MGKSGENTGRPPLPNKEVVRLGKAIYEKDLSPDPPKRLVTALNRDVLEVGMRT